MRPNPAFPASALLVLLLGLLPAPAQAWGRPAHRLVAGLAEARLRPAARAEALRLLATEGATDLAQVSDWADEVRREGGTQGRDTRRWHFVNFEGGCEYAPARDCPDGDCIVEAIRAQSARLADTRLPDAERTEALKFLVHLVADVHQPLHTTPKALRGGLGVQVQVDGKGSNLHLAWDVALPRRALEATALDEAGYLQRLRSQAPLPAEASRGSAVEWAQQSCRVIDADRIRPAARTLGEDYFDAHRARMDTQLRLAGARLADVLNLALDPARPATAR